MLGEMIGELKGKISGIRVFPMECCPKMECSFQDVGKILDVEVTGFRQAFIGLRLMSTDLLG